MAAFQTFAAVRLFSNFVCKGTGCGGKNSLRPGPCIPSPARLALALLLCSHSRGEARYASHPVARSRGNRDQGSKARAASKFRELRVSGLQHKVVGGARTQASHLLLLNSHAWSPKKIRCKMAGDDAGQDTPCEIDSEPVCMYTSSAPVAYSARLDLVVLSTKALLCDQCDRKQV